MYSTLSRGGGMYPPMRPRRRPGRLLWPLLWLLLIIYIVDNPTDAAANARDLIHWLHTGTNALATFIDQTRTHP